LVGGSYAGTMVAWFLQRYPNLASGAWSSSAPLRAKVDFPEYKEIVGLAVRTVGGQPCYDRIQRAFEQIETAMTASQFSMLDAEFNTCTSLSRASELDRFSFLDSISHVLSGSVQGHSGTQISAACTEIMNAGISNDLKDASWGSHVANQSCKSLGEVCMMLVSKCKSPFWQIDNGFIRLAMNLDGIRH
jgi:Serine carboxypeptidase S28